MADRKKPAAKNAAAAVNLLVALQEPEDHLAEVGSGIAADRLPDVARRRLQYALEDELKLANWGFNAPWRAALEPYVQQVDDAKDDRVNADSVARPSGRAAREALHAGDDWFARYNVLRHIVPPKLRDALPPVKKTDHERKAMATELGALASVIEKHAAETAPFGGGAAFAAEGAALSRDLAQKRATHASDLGKVPASVRAMHVVEGVVYTELARLSRAAQHAVAPERRHLYVLDELHHLSRVHEAPSGAQPAPSGTAKA